SDIVCSAISALTQTAVLGLQSIEHLPLGVSIDEEEGIHCVLGEGTTPTQLHDAQLILRTMHLGLSSIQNAYEDTLNITQREV
ncbi:ribosomal-processing cysteine protease Prp, partial [Eubacteriales bacterium OttesenSCG-928-K08]|nr:ribosomal-processing cysteine protease Prp [Eubacteriales bacterium OttesenSCG-928-K08]